MVRVLLHFLAGTLGSFGIFLIFTKLSGTKQFSLPLGLVFFGISCAVIAHYLTPWATPILLFVYGLVQGKESWDDHRWNHRADTQNKSNSK